MLEAHAKALSSQNCNCNYDCVYHVESEVEWEVAKITAHKDYMKEEYCHCEVEAFVSLFNYKRLSSYDKGDIEDVHEQICIAVPVTKFESARVKQLSHVRSMSHNIVHDHDQQRQCKIIAQL